MSHQLFNKKTRQQSNEVMRKHLSSAADMQRCRDENCIHILDNYQNEINNNLNAMGKLNKELMHKFNKNRVKYQKLLQEAEKNKKDAKELERIKKMRDKEHDMIFDNHRKNIKPYGDKIQKIVDKIMKCIDKNCSKEKKASEEEMKKLQKDPVKFKKYVNDIVRVSLPKTKKAKKGGARQDTKTVKSGGNLPVKHCKPENALNNGEFGFYPGAEVVIPENGSEVHYKHVKSEKIYLREDQPNVLYVYDGKCMKPYVSTYNE